MIKSLGVLCVLFVASSLGQFCGTTASDRNVTFSVYFAKKSADDKTYFFDITVFNSLPGVANANDAGSRISYVNSFAFANFTSGGLVSRPHIIFWSVNGGSSYTQQFSVPKNYTGEGKCLLIGFAYSQFGSERYFYGYFELDKNNVAPVVARDEIAEEAASLQARSCPAWTFLGSGFTAVSGTGTQNAYYLKSGATSYTSVSVSMSSSYGVSCSLGAPGPTWATWGSSATKNGNVNILAAVAGSYTVTVTVTYSCGAGGSDSSTFYVPLEVSPAGGKRSLESSMISSSDDSVAARSDYSLVVASVGTAIAGVALIVAAVAVLIVRRRSYSAISA